MRIEIVKNGDQQYTSVCALAGDLYEHHLQLRPLHYPDYFVALFDNDGRPVGGGGLNWASKQETLLVDMLLQRNQREKRRYLQQYQSSERDWVEISCFHMSKKYARDTSMVLGYMYWYLDQCTTCTITFNILTRLLRPPLRQIGAIVHDICDTDPTLITGAPDAFMSAFTRNYLVPAREPRCVAIPVRETAHAFSCSSLFRQARVGLGPQFRAATQAA